MTGRAKKSWKFYEDLDMLEEATGDSPKVNPAYTYGVADGTPRSSLNVYNSESDEDSQDAEDDEIGSTEKRGKTLKSRAR